MRLSLLAPAILVSSILIVSAKVEQIYPAYPHNALEPYISAHSLEQHLALHAWYIQRTNELIEGTVLDKLPLQAVVLTAPYKNELYNMSSQAYNHNFEWQILAPHSQGGGGAPHGKLGLAIDKTFGSLQGLKEAFLAEVSEEI
jgi:Fe-Mn family superoxide dismutase